MRPLGVIASIACLALAAGGAAYAARPQQAVFRVSLSATLTKDWTFTRAEDEGACTRTIRGVGRWQASVSTLRLSRVRAVAAAGGRVRFLGANLRMIAGLATQMGRMTVVSRGAPACEHPARTTRCNEQRRSFRSGFASFASPRRGVLRLGALRGAAPIRTFSARCPEEPAEIRAVRTDLPQAAGPLDRSDVFARDVRRWFITGDSEQVTTIEGDVDGRVTERVRWTLTFTRVR
jgi:hypothetical protein